MKYDDGRFAKHPRFRFFALNTEMRWRANETGRFYIKQHPGEAHLTVDDLRDMIGREGERFANKVVHYGTSLRGTKQYWFKERNKLIAMIDTLGLPTIFFTHSAADHQWPELASLICPEDPDDKQARAKAVVNNPALADWFFTYRIQKFVEVFYVGILGATDYWMRFEWQHRGSPHVHGLAWLPNAPNVENLLSSSPESTKEKIIEYADKIISTINPAVLPDGSNISDAPPAKVDPHICNKPYSQVTDFEEDLIDLIATCQRHTRCSESYCLRTRNGKQECRFGYPKDLQAQTTINITEEEPVILTARNDGMLNSFNPIQLTSWRANVDMQLIVSRNRVVQYCTKYVTKSETRSQSLKDTFANIANSLKEGNKSVKLFRSSSLTVLERGTFQHRKPVTFYCSSLCTRHQEVSLLLVLMAPEVLTTLHKRERGQQLILCWITICHVQLLHSSIPSLYLTSLVNTPCQRSSVMNQRRGVKKSWSLPGLTVHLIHLAPTMSSIVVSL